MPKATSQKSTDRNLDTMTSHESLSFHSRPARISLSAVNGLLDHSTVHQSLNSGSAAQDAAPISACHAGHTCCPRSVQNPAQQYQTMDGHVTVLHPDNRAVFVGPTVAVDSSRAQEWVEVDANDALGANASAGWSKSAEMQAWCQQKLQHGLGSAVHLQGALADAASRAALKYWPLPDLVAASVINGSSTGSPQPPPRPATGVRTESGMPWPAPTRIPSGRFIGASDQDMGGSGLPKNASAADAADSDLWVLLGSDRVYRQPTFEEVPSPELPSIDEEAVLKFLDDIMDEASSEYYTVSLSSSADHWIEAAEEQVCLTNLPLATQDNVLHLLAQSRCVLLLYTGTMLPGFNRKGSIPC